MIYLKYIQYWSIKFSARKNFYKIDFIISIFKFQSIPFYLFSNGTGTILESSDIQEEEAYQLKEVEEEEDELPAEIGTPSQEKRLSKVPVPNLHKPIDTPDFDDPVAKFLETGRTPGGSLSVNGPPPDDGLSLM